MVFNLGLPFLFFLFAKENNSNPTQKTYRNTPMDSFEARIQLTRQLSTLQASRQAAQDCSKFLLRNKDQQDDLFSVILDSLDSVDLNIKVNIFQFLEELALMSMASSHNNNDDSPKQYLNLIQRNLRSILCKLLPKKPEGSSDECKPLCNLNSAYKILLNLSKLYKFKYLNHFKNIYNSNLLSEKDLEYIDLNLKFDDEALYSTNYQNPVSQPLILSEDESEVIISFIEAWEFIVGKRHQSQYERKLIDSHYNSNEKSRASLSKQSRTSISKQSNKLETPPPLPPQKNSEPDSSMPPPPPIQSQPPAPGSSSSSSSTSSSSKLILTHKQMLMRIEADRERQKRGKENMWQVSRPSTTIPINANDTNNGNGSSDDLNQHRQKIVPTNMDIAYHDEFSLIYGSFDAFDPVVDKPLIDELNEVYSTCLAEVKPGKSNVASTKTQNNNHKNNSSNSNSHGAGGISSSGSGGKYQHSEKRKFPERGAKGRGGSSVSNKRGRYER